MCYRFHHDEIYIFSFDLPFIFVRMYRTKAQLDTRFANSHVTTFCGDSFSSRPEQSHVLLHPGEEVVNPPVTSIKMIFHFRCFVYVYVKRSLRNVRKVFRRGRN